MFTSTRRLIALGMGVLLVVVVATLASLLLPPRQTGDVAVPAVEATPEQVVGAYLDALNAHDCETAEALAIDGAQDSAKAWCEDIGSLTAVEVADATMDRPEDSGHSATEVVARVPVAFNLTWRPLHGDVSMAEGPTTWGYLLIRDSSDSAWRIVDQGVG